MTALELARWQFGITTLYHFIFVPLTIGLAFFTAWAQTKWYRTEDEKWLKATRFRSKLMLIFETTDEAGMSLFAIGSVEGNPGELQRNIEIPGALSLLATGSVNGTVEGINDLNAQYREEFGPGEYAPVVAIAYWSWRVMTGIGFIIALFALVALWYMRKGTFGEGRQGGRPSLEGLQTQKLEASPRF